MASPAYGAEHRRRRTRLLREQLGAKCPGCGRVMLRGMALDASHSTDVVVDPSATADYLQCASCNRRDGGRVGARRRRMRPSRSW